MPQGEGLVATVLLCQALRCWAQARCRGEGPLRGELGEALGGVSDAGVDGSWLPASLRAVPPAPALGTAGLCASRVGRAAARSLTWPSGWGTQPLQ